MRRLCCCPVSPWRLCKPPGNVLWCHGLSVLEYGRHKTNGLSVPMCHQDPFNSAAQRELCFGTLPTSTSFSQKGLTQDLINKQSDLLFVVFFVFLFPSAWCILPGCCPVQFRLINTPLPGHRESHTWPVQPSRCECRCSNPISPPGRDVASLQMSKGANRRRGRSHSKPHAFYDNFL